MIVDTRPPTRNLALDLVRVTESAALAAGRFVGRGDKVGADKAAVDAMRLMLNTVPMKGVVVIGEGEKMKPPCSSMEKCAVLGHPRGGYCGGPH